MVTILFKISLVNFRVEILPSENCANLAKSCILQSINLLNVLKSRSTVYMVWYGREVHS